MPNEDTKDYLIRMLSYCSQGDRYLEKFNIFTGVGGNGKSLLALLVKIFAGMYYYEPDVTLLTTKKKDSSGANPELMKAKGARFLVMTEPEESDAIQTAKLKKMTGGDLVQARGLYADCDEYKPQFHVIIMCNDIPRLSSTDVNGIARRLDVVEFPFTFTDKPNPDIKTEKQIDLTLKKKFEDDVRYRQQLARILFDTYEKHVKGNKPIDIPENVSSFTKAYLHEQNVVNNFIDDNCEFGQDYKVERTMLFEAYKDCDMFEPMKASMFYKKVEANGFKPSKDRGTRIFKGLRLKEEDASDEPAALEQKK
jgi:putative DNA primase/helicase